MILQHLKTATQPHHDRVEARVGLLAPGLTRSEYRRLLEAFWGFYLPVEQQLSGLTGLDRALPDLNARWKARAIERDLEVLGLGGDARRALPICRDLPPLATVAQGLGCAYVLEGATLGGQVISRHVSPRVQVTSQCGGAFFASYGPRVGAMWSEFRRRLTDYTAALGEEAAIVASACATFVAFDAWLNERGFHECR